MIAAPQYSACTLVPVIRCCCCCCSCCCWLLQIQKREKDKFFSLYCTGLKSSALTPSPPPFAELDSGTTQASNNFSLSTTLSGCKRRFMATARLLETLLREVSAPCSWTSSTEREEGGKVSKRFLRRFCGSGHGSLSGHDELFSANLRHNEHSSLLTVAQTPLFNHAFSPCPCSRNYLLRCMPSVDGVCLRARGRW